MNKMFLSLVGLLLAHGAIADNCNNFRVKLKKQNGQVEIFNKVQTAVNAANRWDKIILGTYNFNEVIKIKNKKDLVLRSNCQASIKGIKINYSKDIKVKKITIDADNSSSFGIQIQGNSERIKLKNVIIENAKNDGIKVASSVKRFVLESSEIKNNDGNGIFIAKQNTGNHAIRNTEITSNGRNGVVTGENKIKILNSVVSGNGLAGNSQQGYGLKRVSNSKLNPKRVKVINSSIINNNGKIKNTSPLSTIDIGNVELIADELDIGNTTTSNTEFPTLIIKPVAVVEADKKIISGDIVKLDGSKSYNPLEGKLSYKWRLIEKPSSSTATIINDELPLAKIETDLVGVYKVGLIVTSGEQSSLEEILWLTTLNTRPVANLKEDRTISVGDFVTIDGSESSDLEQSSLTYNWSFKSKPAGSSASLSGASDTASFTADLSGDYIVELFVNDGTSDSKTRTITFSTVNSAPKAVANESFISTIGTDLELNASQSTDYDNDTLTYEWSVLYSPDESMNEITNPSINPALFTADVNGIYIFQVIALDSTKKSKPYVFSMEVNNTIPVAEIVIGSPFIETAQSFEVDGSLSSDQNNDPLIYKWSLLSKPSGSNTSIPTSSSEFLNFTPDISGTYELQLIVNDGYEDSSAVNVSLEATYRPIANINGNTSVNVGEMLKLNALGSQDQDGDELTYNWSLSSKPNESLAPLGNFNDEEMKFIVDVDGNYTFSLVVNDGKLNSAPAFMNVTAVKFINTAPVINDIPGQSIILGTESVFNITGNDSDGEYFFTFSPLPLPEGMEFNARTGEFKYKPAREDVGINNYVVSISDGITSTSKTLVINVIAPPVGTPTSMSGRVLDTTAHVQGQVLPIVGATVVMKGTNVSASTDSNGYFVLNNIPEAQGVLYIDTSTASNAPDGSKYANFGEGITFVEGTNNVHERPFYIPRIDSAGETTYQQNTEVTLSNPNLGVSAVIPATTAVMTPEGSLYNGAISISEVPLSVAPVALPDTIKPSMLLTIQPAGVRFSDPLEVTFSNTEGFTAGSEFEIFSVNVDTGMFEAVGKARVSQDGSKIETYEGGVVAATWHYVGPKGNKKKLPIPSPPRPPRTYPPVVPGSPPPPSNSCEGSVKPTGSSVDLKTGALIEDHAITSYRSFNKKQEITLVYNSNSAVAKPIVDTTFVLDHLYQVPLQLSSRLILNGIDQGFDVFSNSSVFDEDEDVVFTNKLQVDLSLFPTGIYKGSVILGSEYPQSSFGEDFPVSVYHINLKNSHWGAGWSLLEISTLYVQDDGNILVVRGDGSYNVYLFDENNVDEYISQVNSFLTLKKIDGYFVETMKDRKRIYYDNQGKMIKLVDKNNNSINYKYSGEFLTERIDEVGLKYTFTYLDGKVESITDPAGKVTSFRMEDGNLIEVIDPDQISRLFSYNEFSQLVTQTKKSGYSNSYSYNAFSRLENSILNNGATTESSADQSLGALEGSLLCSSNCNFLTRKGSRLNPEDILLEEDEIALYKDFEGSETKLKFDSGFNLSSSESELGRKHFFDRDEKGMITRKVEPNGVEEFSDYDERGNLVRRSLLDGAEESHYSYDVNDEVTEVLTGDQNHTIFERDENGNIAKIIYLNGSFFEFKYNNKGQIIQRRDSVNRITSFQYNKKTGNLIKTTYPDGSYNIRTHDDSGNIISQTDEKFNSNTAQFDVMNRQVMYTLADGIGSSFEYDNAGNLVLLTDARNQSSVFNFDTENRLVHLVDPNGREEHFEYNNSGALVRFVDKEGKHTAYTYNADGQVVSESRYDSLSTYDYFTNGNLESIENESAKINYSYHHVTGDIDTVTYEGAMYPSTQIIGFDRNLTNGKINSIHTNDQSYRSELFYDNQDLLSRISAGGGDVYIDYDHQLRRSKLRYSGGGVEAIYNFDSRDRIKTLEHKMNQMTISKLSLTYDKVGNITSKTLENNLPIVKDQTFSYDQTYQVTSEVDPFTGASTSFEWDQLGNRLSLNNNSFKSIYDDFNRIVEDEDFTYSHDPNGNMILKINKQTGFMTEYFWNASNKLMSIVTKNAEGNQLKIVDYKYGPEGRRLAKEVDGAQVESYLYSGSDIIRIFKSSGVIDYYYTDKIDEPVMMKSNGSVYYLHTDQLGSIIAITDIQGSTIEQYAYSAFGQMKIYDGSGVEIQSSQIGNIFGFTGREFDAESDLYYYRARYYDPNSGRFLTADPIGFDGGDANLYRYVENNPIYYIDPYGLKLGGITGTSTGQAIGSVIGAGIGGVLGSSLGPIGTIGGGVLGGSIGGALGGLLGGGNPLGSDDDLPLGPPAVKQSLPPISLPPISPSVKLNNPNIPPKTCGPN